MTISDLPVGDNSSQPNSSAVSEESSLSNSLSPVETVPSGKEESDTTENTLTDPSTNQQPSTVSTQPADAKKQQNAIVTEPVPEKSMYTKITEALLDRIGDPAAASTFKMCLYGPPGGTKSSFLGRIPNNLVYDQEDGAIAMKTQQHYTGEPMAPGVQALPFTSFNEAEFLLERLLNDDPAFERWTCFSVDTFSDFHKKALADLKKRQQANAPSINIFDVKTDDHAENNLRMLDYVRRLRDLRRDIVITAHSRTVEPKGKPAKTFPDFSESLANKIEAMMDIVGYMEMTTIEEGKPPVPVLRVISEGTIHAKTRIPLPPVIVNPKWSDLKAVWLQWKDKTDEEKAEGQATILNP